MKSGLLLITISTLNFLFGSPPVVALDPSLEIGQYAHTAWTVRDGFSLGAIYAMAQTPDGYLWLGGENGLFRFDGVHAVLWQPPAGQPLPDKPYSLLVTRDGTLWIGTYAGLVTWRDGKLTRYPEVGEHFVTSLLEDHEGTVWAGILGGSPGTPTGRLCAIRSGHAQCYGEDGAFGSFVWSLGEDRSGALWAGAESGLWRWKPGPPKLYAMPGMRIGDLTTADDGRLLVGVTGAGLKQIAGDKVESYPIPDATHPNRLLPDQDVDSNKLLRDRDGGLWIGTRERGLIHIHNGSTDILTKSGRLSGNISCSLFEDREGNVWFASSQGLDRFRELPVTTISAEQGLSSDRAHSVIAGTDGSIWVATHKGLTRWQNGQITTFRKENGLPDDAAQSLFQDDRGRVWVFTEHGLAYFKDGRFVAVNGVPSEEVYSITGDKAGNLWLSGNRGLSHLRDGRLVEHFPWSALGRQEQAKVVLSDQGGVWLSFWTHGGVLYFKDGQVRASYTAADGLGKGHVPGLQLDRDGAVWAGTEEGGLSRIKDGRIATLTSRNGLPCDTVHWSIEDDDRSLWLYMGCGLVRITRAELEAWIADPTRRIETKVWNEADGVTLRPIAPTPFGPPVAKSTDGKLRFLSGEGLQIVDPRHFADNKLPPPVHIEQIVADNKIYWQNLPGAEVANLRLPALIRDVQIDYTALSLVAPEKVHFKYQLEGQDRGWREVVNDRQVQYSNLAPGPYRFRVIACNNSGVWNEEGATLDFYVRPAYYQTNWFRALCVFTFLAMLWTVYQLRVRAFKQRQAVLERHQSEIRALNEQMVKAQEAERMRIAGDLHDGVLQQITSLTLRLGSVKRQVPPDSEAKTTVNRLQQELIQIGTDIRHISHELHPALLQEAGLPAALSLYCEEFSKVRGLPVACETDESVQELSPGAALCLYRIAQEALGNAAKHSSAKKVQVRLARCDGDVCLSVSDDGVGCAPDQIAKSRGLGVINMRERVLQLNGTFEFDSEPGRGTRVKVTVPFRTAP